MELELNTVFRVNWVLKSPSLHFVTIFGATADTAFNFAIINASLGVRVEVLKKRPCVWFFSHLNRFNCQLCNVDDLHCFRHQFTILSCNSKMSIFNGD